MKISCESNDFNNPRKKAGPLALSLGACSPKYQKIYDEAHISLLRFVLMVNIQKLTSYPFNKPGWNQYPG